MQRGWYNNMLGVGCAARLVRVQTHARLVSSRSCVWLETPASRIASSLRRIKDAASRLVARPWLIDRWGNNMADVFALILQKARLLSWFTYQQQRENNSEEADQGLGATVKPSSTLLVCLPSRKLISSLIKREISHDSRVVALVTNGHNSGECDEWFPTTVDQLATPVQ